MNLWALDTSDCLLVVACVVHLWGRWMLHVWMTDRSESDQEGTVK